MPSPRDQTAYSKALKRIESCRQRSATILDLSGLGLSTIPIEIGQLVSLRRLNLFDNKITAIPSEIGSLSSLTELNLIKNQVAEVPPEIGLLSSLKELYLQSNQFTIIPPEIGKLTSLKTLSVSNNLIVTIPPEIAKFTSLETLFLHSNRIDAIPPEIGLLRSLRKLHLHSNQISLIPPQIGQLTSLTTLSLQDNSLASLPPELNQLRQLQELSLHGNKALGLSPTILGSDPRKTNGSNTSARSILDFYFARRNSATRPLNEVKLVLVGRGSAGKTSTVNALRGEPFHEGEKSTPGIALCDWELDECKGEAVTAHVWDFAGQVITHALHQFFFSTRCIYVVVLTGRENSEREDAEYWLRLIKAFGTDEKHGGPPVIISLNKWDVSGCRPKVDREALRERYPFIRGFVEMDCNSPRRVAKLKKAICREVSGLEWVREPFPSEWDAVRRALSGRGKKAHMPYTEFRDLCTRHGITDRLKQDSLAEILHNLGAALNYRNDPRLREATVLQPHWLTRNVYALMRRAEKQTGTLKQPDVDLVLSKEKDPAMRAYLIHLMERFEIAYAAKATGNVWLIPQALPDSQPTGVSAFRDAVDATRLRYTYQALPEGLVARAVVRLHEFIEVLGKNRGQWASGAILARENARALLRAEPQDRQVMITVTGPAKARQQLAGLCQAEMREIHSDIPGLDPLEETEYQGVWVPTATLESDEKLNRSTGIPTRGGTLLVDPTEANNAYSEPPARSEDEWKPLVFISYSKANVKQRRRLESELKVLMNEGLIRRHWHDRMIAPGDEWHDVIQDELTRADVIILLISTEALATEYITKHEIPRAMARRQPGKIIVVPVILEPCRWQQTVLGPLNGLPEKAKAIDQWPRSSAAWNSVAEGLAAVFRDLIKSKATRKKEKPK